ncbi:hypothetical protein F5Y19DRAFT_477825 [Xylariaceae sp. FL1651]|nr:hypothetical protein F5Y19DRAFT_477825 [Xylariaceae sp. FL1651]
MSNNPNSNNATYWGETPPKPAHSFTARPPTNHAEDQQSLLEYRLSTFAGGPSSAFQPPTHSTHEIKTTHRARVAAQIHALQSKLP